jgi:hypothetical protein
MADVTTNALRGLVKTLNDVVVPAIPADDPLALQELKMVVRYLNFARERVDHLYARARFELTFYSDLIAQLAEPLGKSYASHAHAIADLRNRAVALLAQPGAGIEDLRNLNLEITSTISTILGEVSDAAILARLERAVVLASAEITAFDRSWYAPLKLERFPEQVRPLSSFIPVPKAVS